MKEKKVIYFSKPRFEQKFERAIKHKELEHLTPDEWLTVCNKGMPMTFYRLQDKLKTTATSVEVAKAAYPNLTREKRENFEHALEMGNVEMPLVVDTGKGLVLVSGNTRLTGLVIADKEAMVWMVTL